MKTFQDSTVFPNIVKTNPVLGMKGKTGKDRSLVNF